MGKCLNIQLDNICIPALVVAMAMAAFGISCQSSPVNTLPLPDICVDFLVTVPAQQILTLLAEGLVAFFTVFLIFRMPLYYLPGLDQRFDSSGTRPGIHGSHEEKSCKNTYLEPLHHVFSRETVQYICTAYTCTRPASNSMRKSGRWRICHIENSRSKNLKPATFLTVYR